MRDNTHYSIAQDPARLSTWADDAAQQIKANLGRGEVPVLCYRGLSGVAPATVLACALFKLGVKHGMAYARKRHEQSHGQPVERKLPGLDSGEHYVLTFVDDFVASGETRDTVLAAVKDALSDYGPDLIVSLTGDKYGEKRQPFARQAGKFFMPGRDNYDPPEINEPAMRGTITGRMSGNRADVIIVDEVYMPVSKSLRSDYLMPPLLPAPMPSNKAGMAFVYEAEQRKLRPSRATA